MKFTKNTTIIVVSSCLLLAASLVFLITENRGAELESRVGFIFITIIALCLFGASFFTWLHEKNRRDGGWDGGPPREGPNRPTSPTKSETPFRSDATGRSPSSPSVPKSETSTSTTDTSTTLT
jgi:hypothetical protein